MWSWPILGTITPYSLSRRKAVLQVCRVILETVPPPHPNERLSTATCGTHPVKVIICKAQTIDSLCYQVCHSYGLSMRRRVVRYVDNNGSKKPAACILHPEGRRQKLPNKICNVYKTARRHVRPPCNVGTVESVREYSI
jgi:hypothetical protein